MKLMYKIVLSILLFTSIPYISYSQDLIKVDTAITVSLENIRTNGRDREFTFDIYLLRRSGIWHLWENATFQMVFFTDTGKTTEIDYSNFDVFVDASSSEVLTIRDGSPAYSFHSKVLYDAQRPNMNRVKLMVLGPEEAIYSRLFEDNIKLKLCEVTLKANSMLVGPNDIPVTLDWKWYKNDSIYFQATAYTHIDSVNINPPEYVIVADNEDHIEIGWVTEYVVPPHTIPRMMLEYFEVEYTGNLNAVCRYSTLQEINNAGFVIKRARTTAEHFYKDESKEARDAKYHLLPDSIFNVVVGDYRLPQFASRMTGMLFSHTGKQYVPIPDTLDYRMVNYVYRLYYQEVGADPDVLKPLATTNLLTPNGVITQATAEPNPCAGKSKIRYTVDDDVFLTCEVFDQNGGSVKKLHDDVNGLLDMKYVPKGVYYADFEVSDLAVQGLYEVIFIAYPVNDKSVEISTATVKVQVIRGYSPN